MTSIPATAELSTLLMQHLLFLEGASAVKLHLNTEALGNGSNGLMMVVLMVQMVMVMMIIMMMIIMSSLVQ